jgi:hypothetical protein
LRRGLGFWELIFESRWAVFKHDQGALYVACLLLDPPPEPIHAVALALKARKMNGQSAEEAELIQERNLGLDDAEAVRNLRRKQRELEAVLDDELAIEPVKAEARREREEILEFLRKNSWRTRDNAGRCVRAVAVAIKRFHARLAKGVDAPPAAPQFLAVAPQSLVITNTSGVVAVKLTCPTNPGENTVLRASPLQNSAVRACRNFRIIGTCPAPAQGSADITSLYVAEFGAVPIGKRLFVQASTMVDGFESLPRQFQARVPAA